MFQFEKPGSRDDDYPELAKEAIVKAMKDSKVPLSEVQKAVVGYIYGKFNQLGYA